MKFDRIDLSGTPCINTAAIFISKALNEIIFQHLNTNYEAEICYGHLFGAEAIFDPAGKEIFRIVRP